MAGGMFNKLEAVAESAENVDVELQPQSERVAAEMRMLEDEVSTGELVR